MSNPHQATPCCNYVADPSQGYPVFWNPFNGVVQCHNCGHTYSPEASGASAEYWKNRSLQAEDLIERMQTWEEVLPKQERLEQLQSNVARIRAQFRREGFSEFCAELVPLCKDDSWVSIEERKPPLSEPIVQVLFDNGEIAESQFYIGAFENNFLSFCTKRPDSKITHWRPKKTRS